MIFWRLMNREQCLLLYFNNHLQYRIPATNNECSHLVTCRSLFKNKIDLSQSLFNYFTSNKKKDFFHESILKSKKSLFLEFL